MVGKQAGDILEDASTSVMGVASSILLAGNPSGYQPVRDF